MSRHAIWVIDYDAIDGGQPRLPAADAAPSASEPERSVDLYLTWSERNEALASGAASSALTYQWACKTPNSCRDKNVRVHLPPGMSDREILQYDAELGGVTEVARSCRLVFDARKRKNSG